MLQNNFILQETMNDKIEDALNLKKIVNEAKQLLNLCKVGKYKSKGECVKFYNGFFLCDLNGPTTFDQWNELYRMMLSDIKFTDLLCGFMMYWQPVDYKGIFQVLINLVDSELKEKKDHRIRYLSNALALFQFLKYSFDSISNTILPQTKNPKVVQFVTTLNSVIQSDIFYLDKLLKNELHSQEKSEDSLVQVIHGSDTSPLEEDVTELLNLLENVDSWISEYMMQDLTDTIPIDLDKNQDSPASIFYPVSEGVVNKAVEKAKLAKAKSEKAERAFDELVSKKVREIRTNRRNRRHSELVGETLRINEKIKRLMKAGGLSIIHPAVGIIYWIISVVIDKKTAASDRAILIQQIEDELEIIEEKISIAERNGDDKGKIELMRIRQRLEREYKRIRHVKYDRNAR